MASDPKGTGDHGAPTDQPTMTCQVCGGWLIVRPDGRGFPPNIARRRLTAQCRLKGHACVPKYRAGVTVGLRPTGQVQDGGSAAT